MRTLSNYIEAELALATRAETRVEEFAYLERAHILGQYSTWSHVNVHVQMLKWAWREKDVSEFVGQIVRIVGAATKTAIGLVPRGNTGGANVSAFKPMPIPDDLAAILARYSR